jgi:hypothetical protein
MVAARRVAPISAPPKMITPIEFERNRIITVA